MDGLKCGIGVLPDERVRKAVEAMNTILGQHYGVSYHMGGAEGKPHLTLLQTRFTSQMDLSDVLHQMLKEGIAPVDVLNETIALAFERFVFLDCAKTPSLQVLQQRLVDRCVPILVTEGPSIVQSQNLAGLTPLEIENIQTYGYPCLGEASRPHFTVGALRKRSSGSIERGPVAEQYPSVELIQGWLAELMKEMKGYRFQPKELVIYELGQDGARVGIAESFRI